MCCVFVIFTTNAIVYGLSVAYIDNLNSDYVLIAYTFWCFLGDLGPILGAELIDIMRGYICNNVEYTYTCKTVNEI